MLTFVRVGVVTLLTFFVAGTLEAQNPFDNFKDFSATMVTNAAPKQGMKTYRSGNRMRTDMPGGYMVTELDTHKAYMVMSGMCMQMSATQQNDPFATSSSDAKVERSPAGKETVDGHACKVDNITITPKNEQPTKMKVWEAEDLKGFPVKIETQTEQGPVTVLYKDISFAKPDLSLFNHPANCQQMPAGMGTVPR